MIEEMNKLKPITPGEMLLEEFLKPMSLSPYCLAKDIGGLRSASARLFPAGVRSITADTDLRLCRFFGLSNGYSPSLAELSQFLLCGAAAGGHAEPV